MLAALFVIIAFIVVVTMHPPMWLVGCMAICILLVMFCGDG